MRKPKKILNNPNNVRSEVMEGLVYAYQGELISLPSFHAVYRKGINPKQVIIVSGGGSGHEPTFAGYIGKNGIDACALGEIFASPSPDQIIEVAKAAHQGNGVLFLYGNYSGDGMNFDIAAEILADEGIESRTLRATDDVASAPKERAFERRGVAGIMFLYKIVGTAAQHFLYDLAQLHQLAEQVNANIRTIGVALDGCALPQAERFNFTLAEDEVEIGIGIHGEAGLYRSKLTTCDEIVEDMLNKLLADLPLHSGDSVCVSINNLGALSNTELLVISRKVGLFLQTRNIHSHDVVIGHFCTSLEMSGFSISLMKLDEKLRQLYDLPMKTLGWRK